MDDSYHSSHRHDEIEALYRQHYEPMLTLALGITGDQAAAEDACHRVFFKLLTGSIRAPLTLNYLLIATRNACLDSLRQTRRLVILQDIHPAPPPPDTEDAQWGEALFAEWYSSLTPPQQTAIALQLDGLSCATIATAMRCGIGTVRTHLYRARGKLRVLVVRERERERERVGCGEWGVGVGSGEWE